MRIRPADSRGRIEPQFVVEAENAAERMLLKSFCEAQHHSKEPIKFWLHSWGYQAGVDGVESFNFGWIKDKPEVSHGRPIIFDDIEQMMMVPITVFGKQIHVTETYSQLMARHSKSFT